MRFTLAQQSFSQPSQRKVMLPQHGPMEPHSSWSFAQSRLGAAGWDLGVLGNTSFRHINEKNMPGIYICR